MSPGKIFETFQLQNVVICNGSIRCKISFKWETKTMNNLIVLLSVAGISETLQTVNCMMKNGNMETLNHIATHITFHFTTASRSLIFSIFFTPLKA